MIPFKKERIKTLNTNNIEIDDIITNGEKSIIVKDIIYNHSFYSESECYIEFIGIPLTKTLKPMKKETNGFIQQRYGIIPEIIKKH